jgi:hypothetical protein
MLRDSASGHISVGPKTMARFGMCMRLNSLNVVTLQQNTINNTTCSTTDWDTSNNNFTSCYVWLWNKTLTLKKKLCLKTCFQKNIYWSKRDEVSGQAILDIMKPGALWPKQVHLVLLQYWNQGGYDGLNK